MTVEPRCPACGTRFVLTGCEPTVFPTHFLDELTNPGKRGRPIVRQGTTACPMSGAALDATWTGPRP